VAAMKLAVLAVLAVLLSPSSALQGCPVVLHSHGCSSSPRVPRVLALDRPARQPITAGSSVGVPLAQPPVRQQRNVLQRVIGGLRTALLVGAAGIFMRAPGAPTALAAKTAPKTPPAPTKQANTGATSFLTTAAMGGGLVYWSIRVASEEDKEEQERIKSESEKMESMAKEYTDIDGGVTVDEDLMASLRSRMGNSTEASGGDEPGSSGGGGGGEPEPPVPPPSFSGGGVGGAVLDAPEPPEDAPQLAASQEDIERLKRMFGGSEES